MEKVALSIGLCLILASLCSGILATDDAQYPDLSACNLSPETGPCKAAFRRYYFNLSTGKCGKFIYGGCAGNANNFGTLAECERFGKRCLNQNA